MAGWASVPERHMNVASFGSPKWAHANKVAAAYTDVNGRSVVCRQYRHSLRFVAGAAAGLVLVGVASADSQTSFVDPTGDAGSSVDITGLRVSSFGVGSDGGGVGFEVTVTRNSNRFWCGGDGGDLPLLIAIDTDQNPDTGSAFYGTEVELSWSSRG